MNPTHLMAKEDFATACLIGLGLEREITGWTVPRFDTRNRRSLKLWKRVAQDSRCKGIHVYAVLSAIDYNTARSAGRLAATEGVANAALGIAGIMLDPSATDFFVIDTARFRLNSPAPRRFVRLAQILRGVADGYRDVGRVLERFHCLGLGASALLPIPAAALNYATAISTDATSPIHDAVRDRVMYDLQHDGRRVSTREIVHSLLNGQDFSFSSPFVRTFRAQFGHDPERARAFWIQQGSPSVTKELLETRSALTAALPLFSDADPVLNSVTSKTRIAHNHWVLDRLSAQFPAEPGRNSVARAALDRMTAESTSATTTRGIAAAMQVLKTRASPLRLLHAAD
jgi:hypothetical protein